jgi:hypothetical protein
VSDAAPAPRALWCFDISHQEHVMTIRPLTSIRWAVLGAAIFTVAGHAHAAPSSSAQIQSRYEHERAACLSGQTAEDQATCLKEAAAARDEARRGRLDNGDQDLRANAAARCAALRGEEQMACEARMAGMGRVSGSVEGGGLLREIKIRKVEPAEPMPLPAPTSTLPAPPAMPPSMPPSVPPSEPPSR